MDAKERTVSIERYKAMLPKGYSWIPSISWKFALSGSAIFWQSLTRTRKTRRFSFSQWYMETTEGFFQRQFYTRNIVTGDKEIQGEYFQNKFNAIGTSGSNIASFSKNYHAN